MQNRNAINLLSGALGLVLGAVGTSAFAQEASSTVDYSGMVSGMTAEIGTAISAALPVAGIVLAALIGYRIFKKFAKG